MTDKNADTQEFAVPRCVKCGHAGEVTKDGVCFAEIVVKGGFSICGHKCEAPAPAQCPIHGAVEPSHRCTGNEFGGAPASVPQGPELKPCFCGNTPVYSDAFNRVRCNHCFIGTQSVIGDAVSLRGKHVLKREAYAAWNTRPADADRVARRIAEKINDYNVLSFYRANSGQLKSAQQEIAEIADIVRAELEPTKGKP